MTPLDFLKWVIPETDEGFAVVHWKIPEVEGGPKTTFYGKSCKTAEDMLRHIDSLKGKGFDIWFALSRQRVANNTRNKANANFMRCVVMDGDIDPENPDCFPSLAEAIASVFIFCDQVGIPRPSLIVMSGGGIHIYWVSDRDLDIETWQDFADHLRAAIDNKALRIKDKGITTNAAQVLRPPGTTNCKHGLQRPVYIMKKFSTFEQHDFSKVFEPLKKYTPISGPTKSKSKLPPVDQAFAHLDKDKTLGAGIEGHPPVPFAPVKAGCPWLREAHDTGGRDFDQPQWHLSVLCAVFTEEGNELAHQLSNQHPTYTYEKTEDMWDRKVEERLTKNLGWPSCTAILRDGSKHCASCAHFKLGRSPLHLGSGAFDDAPFVKKEPDDAEIEQALAEVGGTRPEDLRLPKGFALDPEGRICAFFPSEENAKGQVVKPARLLHILKTQIKNPTLQWQDGVLGLGFVSNTFIDNWHDVFISGPDIEGAGLLPALNAKSVFTNPDRTARDMLKQFTSSWIDLLSKTDEPIKDTGTMGWRYINGKRIGFAYGGFLYLENGTKQPMLAIADNEFYKHYQPVGSKDAWLKSCKLLTDRKRPELDILIAVGFAAPLTVFGGTLYGVTLSLWGDPGTSKSTAQQVAAAIFGHPKQTRESLNSTPKSVQRRLGLTRNLAAYWDDIQDERHQDNLFTTMFVAAGGLEGGRLNQDASMKERLDWQTLLVACSNASFIEYLTRKQKSTTAGMRRVFEIQFKKDVNEPGMVDAVDASRTFAELEHNYGAIGAEYARILAMCHPQIDGMVEHTTKKFKAAVDGEGDESYWWGLCGVLLAGATIARKLGADLDIEAMDTFLQAAFRQNRDIRLNEGTEGGTYDNTARALIHCINKYAGEGHIIYTNRLFSHPTVPVNMIYQPGDNRQILVQVGRDERMIMVSKRALREYLVKNEIQPRQVFDGLIKDFEAEETKRVLGGGTTWALGQELCFVIPVPKDDKHPLREILYRHGAPGTLLSPLPTRKPDDEDSTSEV